MTIQAYFLLRNLKKAQQREEYKVQLDALNCLLSTVGCGNDHIIDISMEESWGSVDSRIEHLQAEGLLKVIDKEDCEPCVQLTHAGYHYVQTILTSLGRFLFRSILVPIVVAFGTTLITLWVNSIFNFT